MKKYEKNRIFYRTSDIDQEFYWERVNRSLGWLGNTEEEQKQTQQKLSNITVGLAGCGGIGGMVASRLGRLGIKKIKLADPDSFDVSNINRQIGASPANLKRNKAEVVAELVNDVTPDIDIDVFTDGILPQNAEEFVEGCDYILDQMDFYEVKNRYALHRAFRKSPKFKFALKVPTVAHGTYIFKYTKESMHIEDVYGIDENTTLTPEAILRLMERIMPQIPDYPSREMLKHWFIDLKRMPIFAACPPLAEGVLLERLTIEMAGLGEKIPNYKSLPEQPGYAFFDTASWEARLFNGKWWDNDNIVR